MDLGAGCSAEAWPKAFSSASTVFTCNRVRESKQNLRQIAMCSTDLNITFTFGFILYVQRKKWEHITIVFVNVLKKKTNKQYYHGALWCLSKNLHVKKQSTTPLSFVVTSSQQQFSKQKMSQKLTCASVISVDHHRVKSWPTGPKFMLSLFPAKHHDDRGSTIQYNHIFSPKNPILFTKA